jgi:hypothetical protein
MAKKRKPPSTTLTGAWGHTLAGRHYYFEQGELESEPTPKRGRKPGSKNVTAQNEALFAEVRKHRPRLTIRNACDKVRPKVVGNFDHFRKAYALWEKSQRDLKPHK